MNLFIRMAQKNQKIKKQKKPHLEDLRLSNNIFKEMKIHIQFIPQHRKILIRVVRKKII